MVNESLIEVMLKRRSVKVKQLIEPAPNEEELRQILTVAMRVPDHGKLAPFRLLVLDKDGQEALGERFAQRFAALHPNANEKQIAFERERSQRAPLLLVALYVPKFGKIPPWEQQLSCGAMCMNLLQAAHTLGYSSQWLTEWPAYDGEITKALSTEEGAKIAGFIYLGTASEPPEERARPEWDDVVANWPPAPALPEGRLVLRS